MDNAKEAIVTIILGTILIMVVYFGMKIFMAFSTMKMLDKYMDKYMEEINSTYDNTNNETQYNTERHNKVLEDIINKLQ